MLLQPSFNPASSPYITDNAGKPLDKNPLLDVRVRQALNLAINRKAIADRILQGAATEANQWMPKGTFGYNPDIKDIPNDVAQAKKLLAEAGFPDGFKLTMHVLTTTRKAGNGPGGGAVLDPRGCEDPGGSGAVGRVLGPRQQERVRHEHAGLGQRHRRSQLRAGQHPGDRRCQEGLGRVQLGPLQQPQVDAALEQSTSEFDVAKREAILRDSVKLVADDVASSRCSTTRTSGPPRRA